MQAKISAAVSASHHRRNAVKKARQALQSEVNKLTTWQHVFLQLRKALKTCRLVKGQCSHDVAHDRRLCWPCLPVLHAAHAQQPLHASSAGASVRICIHCTVGHAQRSMVMQGSSDQVSELTSASSGKAHTQEFPTQVARPPRVRHKAAKKAPADKFVTFDGISEAGSQDRGSTGR